MNQQEEERQERIAKYKRQAPIQLINQMHAYLLSIHANLEDGEPYDEWQRGDMLDVLDILDVLRNRQSVRLLD